VLAHTPLAGLITLVADGGPGGPYEDTFAAFALELPTGWSVVPGKLVAEAAAPPHVTLGVGSLTGSLAAFIAERDPGWEILGRQALPGGERLAVEQSVRGKPTRLGLAFLAHGANVLTLRSRDEAALETVLAALRLQAAPDPKGPGTITSPAGAFDFPAGWRRDGRLHVRAEKAMVGVAVTEGELTAELEGLEAYLAEHPLHGRVLKAGAGHLGDTPAHRLLTTFFGEHATAVRLIAGRDGRVVELTLHVDVAPEKVPAELLAAFEAMAASWRWS
jgi:hypothetical protein